MIDVGLIGILILLVSLLLLYGLLFLAIKIGEWLNNETIDREIDK